MTVAISDLIAEAGHGCGHEPAYAITYRIGDQRQTHLVCRDCVATKPQWTGAMLRAVDVATGEYMTDQVRREAARG